MRTLVFGSLIFFFCGFAIADDAKEIKELKEKLKVHGFTGNIESTIPKQLGRNLDPKRVELGKMIFFDKGLGLHKDNSCAGCHSPTHAMGDTQSIARGVQNNDIVGEGRLGPRNQRRTPSVINSGFYPSLMWNGRFSALSGNPFDNSKGFEFPLPEGIDANDLVDLFGKSDKRYKHLLVAQAHIPFTETPEMAGFTNICGPFLMPRSIPSSKSPLKLSLKSIDIQRQINKSNKNNFKSLNNDDCEFTAFTQFSDGKGISIPRAYPDKPLLLSSPIRHVVLGEINKMPNYRTLFGEIYPLTRHGNNIEFWMIGEVLAEFQISLTMTNAPIDQFARGNTTALSPEARKGALIFFGKRADCVACHAVKGNSKEMFSDFQTHVAGIPQVVPEFGVDKGNVMFRDANGVQLAGGTHDLGRWEFTELDKDKYAFRTSPLRNVSLQPAFFHNGAFVKLEDAVQFHLDTLNQAANYTTAKAGIAPDLQVTPPGDSAPVLARLSPKLKQPVKLTKEELSYLLAFLSEGLLDKRAHSNELMNIIPKSVPSGETLQKFVPRTP